MAQVVPLADAGLEKLYAYGSWLKRALPSRAAPHGEAVTDDMLTLKAFRLKKEAEGSGALAPGDGERLKPITEFGAKGDTEEEERRSPRSSMPSTPGSAANSPKPISSASSRSTRRFSTMVTWSR